MLRQYFEMKSRVPDAILFYRIGDFYEMFFDDAKEAAPLLGIALTAPASRLRHRGADVRRALAERRPPHREADRGGPQGRRLRPGGGRARRQGPRPPRHHPGRHAGHCPRPRRRSFRRRPRTSRRLIPGESAGRWRFLDLSTGASARAPCQPDASRTSSRSSARGRSCCRTARSCRCRASPGRCAPPNGSRRRAKAEPRAASFEGPAGRGRGAALAYAREMRPSALVHVRPAEPLCFGERMSLDAAALATLEVFESSDGTGRAQPLRVSSTARARRSGARALRERSGAARRPIPMELEARWDAVEELVERSPEREALQPGPRRGRRSRAAVRADRGRHRGAAGSRGVGRGARSASRPCPRPRRGSPAARLRVLAERHSGHGRPACGGSSETLVAGAAGARLGGRRHPRRGGRGARGAPEASPRRPGGAARDRGGGAQALGHLESARALQPRLRLLARGRQRAPREAFRPTGSAGSRSPTRSGSSRPP